MHGKLNGAFLCLYEKVISYDCQETSETYLFGVIYGPAIMPNKLAEWNRCSGPSVNKTNKSVVEIIKTLAGGFYPALGY